MKVLLSMFLPLASTAVVVAKPLPKQVVERVAMQVDRLLVADLQQAKRMPEPIVSDATFVRRAYLGIVGRIPSADEARRFLDDPSASRRDALVEQLVASPGFDSHLFNWAGDLLRVQTRQDQYGLGWHLWLRQSLADDKPWNQLVAEMLRSTGHSTANPAVGYYLRDRNMQLDNFSNTMQVFLGQQMGCAQCHDHPFEDWSQYEYYQMASFIGGMQYRSEEVQHMVRDTAQELYTQKTGKPFGGIEKQGAKKNRKVMREERREKQQFVRDAAKELRPFFGQIGRNAITEQSDAQLRLPKDYKYRDAKPGDVVEPETLFGPKLENVPAESRKDAFAAWVTSPDNPYFTKTIVNRMWQRAFGYSLLDSLDNLTDDSKTAHPQVLEALEHAMAQCGYDLRQFSRILYHTQLFQRACVSDEPAMGQPMLFGGMVLQRMSAEQLYDSLIILRAGKVKDEVSTKMANSWEGYVQMVKTVFNAGPRDWLVLAESAKQGEERFRNARDALREARKMLANADSRKTKIDAQIAVKQARDELNEARAQANPLRPMMQMSPKHERNRDMLNRASELPAPFNLGSMVREFGGSDRESPSSSHAEASVPQALVLLNNWKTNFLSSKQSRLWDQLNQMGSPAGKLEQLFLTFFSEPPSRTEKQRYLPLAKDTKSLRDLAMAMLNSKRFLFIQ